MTRLSNKARLERGNYINKHHELHIQQQADGMIKAIKQEDYIRRAVIELPTLLLR